MRTSTFSRTILLGLVVNFLLCGKVESSKLSLRAHRQTNNKYDSVDENDQPLLRNGNNNLVEKNLDSDAHIPNDRRVEATGLSGTNLNDDEILDDAVDDYYDYGNSTNFKDNVANATTLDEVLNIDDGINGPINDGEKNSEKVIIVTNENNTDSEENINVSNENNDATKSGEDIDLPNNDATKSGEDIDLPDNDATESGEDINLPNNDATESGEDIDLSNKDVESDNDGVANITDSSTNTIEDVKSEGTSNVTASQVDKDLTTTLSPKIAPVITKTMSPSYAPSIFVTLSDSEFVAEMQEIAFEYENGIIEIDDDIFVEEIETFEDYEAYETLMEQDDMEIHEEIKEIVSEYEEGVIEFDDDVVIEEIEEFEEIEDLEEEYLDDGGAFDDATENLPLEPDPAMNEVQKILNDKQLSTAVLALILIVLAFSAFQVYVKPDGFLASVCRLLFTIITFLFKAITYPLRKMFGFGSNSHEPIGGSSFSGRSNNFEIS